MTRDDDGPLTGQHWAITGSFVHVTRDEVKGRLQALGAQIVGSVSSRTDAMVCGILGGGAKLTRAKEMDVPIFSEGALLKRLSHWEQARAHINPTPGRRDPMTRNDLKVSAKRLRNDAEQLRGRQRSLKKLGNGELKPRWEPENRALELAIEALEVQVAALQRQAEELTGEDPA